MLIIVYMGGERGRRVGFSRRELLQQIAGTAACIPFAKASPLLSAGLPQEQLRPPNSFVGPKLFSDSDDALLQELEAASFWYFWEQANPDTGLVRDRCNIRSFDKSDLGSIASTGFGLTALCIGEKRGFISSSEARNRALNTLRFLW